MIGLIKNKVHFLKAVGAVLYYKYPARKLKVIGVTGTDGKTTTSSLIYHLLKKDKRKVALISTVAAYIGRKKIETGLHVTSPNPWFVQKFIKNIVDQNYKYLVLEATSHGLDQHRLIGTNVSVAVLTNITHEHLDYHKTYRKYLKVKSKLFRRAKVAVLNKGDSSYQKIKRLLNPKVKILSYDSSTLKGSIKSAVAKRFPEPYNKINAAAAITVAKLLGVDNSRIVKAIRTFPSVPGRMEKVKNRKGIKIFIDFAHTPNALENVLKALRKKKNQKNKLIAVFGCAGQRDKEKRPMMGQISAKVADVSIFSAEDPRNEDVNEIINQMIKGAQKVPKNMRSKIYEIPERGKAIAFAIQKLAKRGDTIVICGKGHEKSMAYNGEEYAWSDRKAVETALRGKVANINRS